MSNEYHRNLLENFPMGKMYRKDIVIIKEDIIINPFEEAFPKEAENAWGTPDKVSNYVFPLFSQTFFRRF